MLDKQQVIDSLHRIYKAKLETFEGLQGDLERLKRDIKVAGDDVKRAEDKLHDAQRLMNG